MSQKWLILLAFVFAAYLAAQTSNQNNFGGASALPTNLTFVTPTLTVSAATFGNGAVCLSGNTSSCASFTAPAVAGTRTNGVTMTNALLGPVGSATNPTYSFTGFAGAGLSGASGGLTLTSTINQLNFTVNGTTLTQFFSATETRLGSGGILGFSSAAALGSAQDTSLTRSAAGVLAIGAGSAGDTTAKVKASGYMSVGTTFTSNAGCSETSLAGGATAGKFNAGAVSCTLVITMGDTATAPNGWACKANDLTTTADTMIQTATAATTATFSGTVVSGDVINFSCIGY